jgi:glycosyltransferase involved in cell wall biosynthesis
MAKADVFISVVAPLADDADVLEPFVREVSAVLEAGYANYELVLVDDGSHDQTPELVASLLRELRCIRYLRLSRRFGTEAAISAGLDSVIGDFVLVMQPSTDPPELIPAMVEKARLGKGVVFGVRTDRSAEPGWASFGSRLFWWFGRGFLDVEVPEGATYFQCLSRSSVNALSRIKDRYRSLRLLSAGIAAADTIDYEPLRRRRTFRSRGLGKSIDLAVGIIVSQSTRPLRFVSGLGLLAGLLDLLYAGYVVAVYLTKTDVAPGWTTTSLQLSGMFFLLFVILAVLSEYVGRVLEESRGRPLYHAVEERNSNVMVRDVERRNIVRDSR